MKKLFFAGIIFIVVAAALFSYNPINANAVKSNVAPEVAVKSAASAERSANNSEGAAFGGAALNAAPGQEFKFSRTRTNVGMYILREEKVLKNANALDAYEGMIGIETNLLGVSTDPKSPAYFEFTAVKEVNGKWYTAEEYEKSIRGGTFAQDVHDWFNIRRKYMEDGREDFTRECNWEMRMVMPAGKYGVRARAKVLKTTQITPIKKQEEWIDCLDYAGDYQDFYFIILYGTDLEELSLRTESGESSVSVNSRTRNLSVNIASNDGAMRLDTLVGLLAPQKKHYFDTDISYGMLDPNNVLFWTDAHAMTISVMNKGEPFSGISVTQIEGTSSLSVTLPKNLEQGRYIIKVTHEYEPAQRQVFGTFVIDNGLGPIPTPVQKISGIGGVVLGVLGVVGGAALVLGARFGYAINKGKYKAVEDKIYETDTKSVKAREKAERDQKKRIAEGKEKRVRDPNKKGFEERMSQYRVDREAAAKLGMSYEEYVEMQKMRVTTGENAGGGVIHARELLGDGIQITEKVDSGDKLKVLDDNPEVNIVESVKLESAVRTDQFATVNEEAREEALTPIDTGKAGILGKLNKYLGTKTIENKPDNDEPKPNA